MHKKIRGFQYSICLMNLKVKFEELFLKSRDFSGALFVIDVSLFLCPFWIEAFEGIKFI